jgi:hypothetical protein
MTKDTTRDAFWCVVLYGLHSYNNDNPYMRTEQPEYQTWLRGAMMARRITPRIRDELRILKRIAVAAAILYERIGKDGQQKAMDGLQELFRELDTIRKYK